MSQTLPSVPTLALAQAELLAFGGDTGEPQAAEVAVGLALVVQPGDGLLALRSSPW